MRTTLGESGFEVVNCPAFWPVTPSGQNALGGFVGRGHPVDERQRRVIELCKQAVARLSETLSDAEVGGLLLVGDGLRHVAHAGTLRFIYEIPREHGGVAWRAVETGQVQLVEDVRRDPDYLASDERVTSEIAVPVGSPDAVVAVLDVEFPDRVFSAVEAAQVEAEAARLGQELYAS
jgi:putative methionine-R-sulfoxide reductase with GAF domain